MNNIYISLLKAIKNIFGILLILFLINGLTYAQKFEMIDKFETHNWHWYQWGNDAGSLSYSTNWHSQGSSSMKLTSTYNSTAWNIFGTGCFDTETPDSMKIDLYAVNSQRIEVKTITSNNQEVTIGTKNVSAGTQYLNWKINFNGYNMKKLYILQAWYYSTVAVYIDNIRTYKNGVETVWDGFEMPNYYWDGSADADNKDYQVVVSDDITHSFYSPNFNSTSALTLQWDDSIYPQDHVAQIAAKFSTPKDWSDYYYFRADIYRPSTTPDCSLFVFIWDGTKGTGTDWINVPANQWTTVTLKLGQNIDLSNIEEIKIVVPNTDVYTQGKIYIDNLQVGGFTPMASSIETASIGVKYSLDDFDGRVPDETNPDSVARAGYNDYFGYTGGAKSDYAGLQLSLSNNEAGMPARSKPFAWKVNYDVGYDVFTWMSYWNLLGPGAAPSPRDMSTMDKFSLWIKGDQNDGYSNRVVVEFHDDQWGNPGYSSGKAFAVLSGINNDWQQWIIPFDPDSLVIWGTFDPSHLTEVVVSLDSSTASNTNGTFYIDDLQFIDTSEKYWSDSDFDEDFLDLVERRTYNYFREAVNDTTGLVNDRTTFLDLATTAGTGFGLAATVIGTERGWISQQDAEDYVEKVLTTLWDTPQGLSSSGTNGYKGFYYHFLEAGTGLRKQAPAGRDPVELSVVDTGILMAGVLLAREYFAGNSTIVDLADKLYRRIDWTWFYDTNVNQFRLGWSPEGGFVGHWDITTDEVILINILAVGSPTHPVPQNCFYSWIRDVGTYNNHTIVNSWNGSLFQYFFAHCWFDLYGKTDAQNINWWENSIEAGLANRDLCITGIDGSGRTNVPTYSADSWGLTACEQIPAGLDTLYFGENGGLPNYQTDVDPNSNGIAYTKNDGTVAPYGAASMIGFSAYSGGFNETYVYNALKNFYKNTQLWTGTFGFRDCYTDSAAMKNGAYSKFPIYKNNFFSIDEGPMMMMIENYRSKLIWNYLMENDYIKYSIDEIFSPDLRVNDDLTGTTQLSPATDANKDGKYVSVWSDRREGDQEFVYAQRYYRTDDIGTFRVKGINFSVTSGDTATLKPKIGINGNGKFLVTWFKYNDVYAKLFDYDSAEVLTNDIKINSNPIYSNEQSASVASSQEGRFVVAWTGIDNGKDIFAQIVDSTGNKLGNNFKVNGDVGSYNQFEPEAAMSDSGNFVVVWTDNRAGGTITDIYAQRFSKTGSAISSNFKVNGATTNNIKPSVDMNGDGKFIVTWIDTTSGVRNIYAARYDENGNQLGSIISVSSSQNGPAIIKPDAAVDSSGAFMVVWQDSREGSMDIYLQKYSSAGTAIGYNTRAHARRTESSQVNPAVTYLGNDIFQIIWQDDRHGDWDIYCPVGDPQLIANITDVEDNQDSGLPVTYKLSQNYPNPFNPSTTIEFSIPQRQIVKLEIFDMLGQKVASLIDKEVEAGYHKINFDGSRLASGVYVYRVQAGSFVSARKMMLIK